LLQGDAWNPDTGRRPEPVYVVPVDPIDPAGPASGWTREEDLASAAQGMLWTGQAASEAAAPQSGARVHSDQSRRADDMAQPVALKDRLVRALDEALRHSGLTALRDHGDAGGDNPLAVVMPILVFRHAEGRLGPDYPSVRAFRSTLEQLNLAAIELTTGSIGTEVHLNDAQVRVVPWIYIDGGVDDLPPEFFEGHASYREHLLPILYTGFNEAGFSRDWKTYGRTRMLTDLMALRALSTRRGVFDGIFSTVQGSAALQPNAKQSDEKDAAEDTEESKTPSDDERVCPFDFVVMHSALFDYPFNDLVREEVLHHIARNPANGKKLIPEVRDFDSLVAEANRQVNKGEDHRGDDVVADRFERINRAVVDQAIPDDHLDLEPPGGSPCNFTQIKLEPPRLFELSLSYESGELHERVTEHFEKQARKGVEREMRRCIKESSAKFKELTLESEADLRRVFKLDLFRRKPGEKWDYSETAMCSGRVLATLGGLSSKLDELQEKLKGETVEKPEVTLQKLVPKKEGWLDAEEKLFDEGARLPSFFSTAFLASVGGTAIFLLLSRLWFSTTITWWLLWSFLAGAGFAAFVIWRYRKRHEEYSKKWDDHIVGLVNEVNQTVARKLVVFINYRLKQIKFASARELSLALQSCRSRLRTELAGLSSLVGDEIEVRRRRRLRREAEELLASADARGRYRVDLPAGELNIGIDEDAFHADLERLFGNHRASGGMGDDAGSVLSLATMPARLLVSEHEEFIASQVDIAGRRAEASIDETLQERARALLAHTAAVGSDTVQLSKLGGFDLDAPSKVFLAGHRLADRIDCEVVLEDLGWMTNWGGKRFEYHRSSAVAESLPPEWGIVLVAQRGRLLQKKGRE